jgi:hypothetical protein
MNVKKTGGGCFDPKEKSIYFLASNTNNLVQAAPIYDYLLVAVNELETEHTLSILEGVIAKGKKVFLDSGIFFLTNEHARKFNVSMDVALSLAPHEIDGFDALLERYLYIVKKYQDRLWGYIELDQGGRENKIKTRAMLEEYGLSPIPVYHPLNDGWDYFDYLAERYDRICLGNVVQANEPTRLRLAATLWERHQKYPDLWIHVLGYTPNQYIDAYPFNSLDSSSWLHSIRWSGAKERVGNEAFSEMPLDFRYKLGWQNDDDDSKNAYSNVKAVEASAYQHKMQLLNWRNHQDEISDLGCSSY